MNSENVNQNEDQGHVNAPAAPVAAPGWYPVDGVQRYWDGTAWSDIPPPPQATPTADAIEVAAPPAGDEGTDYKMAGWVMATVPVLLGLGMAVLLTTAKVDWLWVSLAAGAVVIVASLMIAAWDRNKWPLLAPSWERLMLGVLVAPLGVIAYLWKRPGSRAAGWLAAFIGVVLVVVAVWPLLQYGAASTSCSALADQVAAAIKEQSPTVYTSKIVATGGSPTGTCTGTYTSNLGQTGTITFGVRGDQIWWQAK